MVKYNKYGRFARYVVDRAGAAAVNYAAGRAKGYAAEALRNLTQRSYDAMKKHVTTPSKKSNHRGRQVVKVLETPKKGGGKHQLVYNRPRFYNNGRYGGKFKRPKKTHTSIFARKGVIVREEITGTVDDNDCVYVKCEVMPAVETIKMVIAAMLRTLLERNGIHCPSWDANPASLAPGKPLAASEMDATYPWVVGLYSKNMDSGVIGQVAVSAPDANAAVTFDTMVNVFYPYFADYVAGFGLLSANNLTKLYCFNIYDVSSVAVGAQLNKVRDTLLFSEAKVMVKSSMNLKIQNRTVGSTGGTTDEDIGGNPIQGRMYLFSGVPKPKPTGQVSGAGVQAGTANKFQVYYTANPGVRGFSPASLDASYKEPPLPGSFWNCYKNSYCRLNPGEIKRYTLKDEFKMMYVEKLLMQIKNQTGAAANDLYFWNNKRNMMFAFEDVIGVNTNPIAVAYECERTIVALCSTKRTSFMLPQFKQYSVAEF